MPSLADYLENTVPRGKQQEAFEACADRSTFFLAMEQRTGKTLVALGRLALGYDRREVDAALVVAMPSGVPANWKIEIDGDPELEKPARWLSRVPRLALVWRASKAKQRSFQQQLDELLNFKGFSFLLVNGEAILSDPFQEFAAEFLKKRSVFAVADETSLLMKTPGGERTKVMNRVRKRVSFRLALDGTPAEESPLDLYSQVGWVDPDALGHRSFYSYKAHYAAYEKGYDPRSGREYPKLIGYRNLPELRERFGKVSVQVRRSDCFDMPEKVYQQYRYQMTPTQERVYRDLEVEHEAELHDGTSVSVPMLLTRYLRYQQVLSNYWPSATSATLCASCAGSGCEGCDEGVVFHEEPPKVIDPNHNPRLTVLLERCAVNREPVIVWARFRHDVREVWEALEALGRKPVIYDGSISSDEKEANRRLFQLGKAGAIVANQSAMQRGVDASAAGWHLFYSNTFSRLQRSQCEDRTELPGRPKGTGIEDLICEGTVDEDIIAAHVLKKNVADFVMGRPSVTQGTDVMRGES